MYMQDYFRCEDGYEAHAQLNAHRACKKLVHDMHYEVRIQAIINYYATEENKKVTKAEARLMTLTKEQFLKVTNKQQDSSFDNKHASFDLLCSFHDLQVPPNWCNNHVEAWEKMVDKWVSPEWLEKHQIARDKRLKMKGPAHHQGSLNLRAYAKRYVSGFISLF